MEWVRTLICAMLTGLLAACSTPHEDAAEVQEQSFEAQEEVARQRLDLVDKYQVCFEEAAGDSLKIEACESYLKAAEALQ